MVDMPNFSGPMCDWPEVRTAPYAKEMLQCLSQKSVCHLATNAKDSSPDQIRAALARANLDLYIKNIYCFRTVGYSKPSVRFFDYIVHDLNVTKSSLIMIGDDLTNDILGAERYGLKAVWYNPNNLPVPNGAQSINSLLGIVSAQ